MERGWRKCNEGEGRERGCYFLKRERERRSYGQEDDMDKERKRTTVYIWRLKHHTSAALMQSEDADVVVCELD